MRHIILIILLILINIPCTYSQEKIHVSTTDDSEFYIYPQTIYSNEYGLNVWTEVIYDNPKYSESEQNFYSSSKIKFFINCNEQTITANSFIHYISQEEILYGFHQNEIETFNTLLITSKSQTNTVGDDIINKVCKTTYDTSSSYKNVDFIPHMTIAGLYKFDTAKYHSSMEKLNQRIRELFEIDSINGNGLVETQLTFFIEADGSISNISAKGTNESLNKEAERVIKIIKGWKPAEQRIYNKNNELIETKKIRSLTPIYIPIKLRLSN